MKRLVVILSVVAVCVVVTCAQSSKSNGPVPPSARSAESANAMALARLALDAHGGEKFRTMRTLIIRGSVDVTTSAVAQAFAASFITIFSGEKYRIEINNPFQPIKQIFDGVNTSSTIRGGLTLPPINRLGLPLLARLGENGFVVTPLLDGRKNKPGFRLTSPEGYFTDFHINDKTRQVTGYDSTYSINGRMFTTSVEIDKLRLVDGILLPEKYAQRFDTEQITIYADFKAREILVNSPVDDDVFLIEN